MFFICVLNYPHLIKGQEVPGKERRESFVSQNLNHFSMIQLYHSTLL